MKFVNYDSLREHQIEQKRRLRDFATEIVHAAREPGMRKSYCIKTDTRTMQRKKK